MRLNPRFVAITSGIGFVLCGHAASAAVCQADFAHAKVAKQGSTSKGWAGSGTVTVQVQVNPNGSFKVNRVIKSTNSGDNQAALDIAGSSSYHPATCGSRATVDLYDFMLVFKGKSVETSGGNSADAATQALIARGNYAAAKAAAAATLASNPNDSRAMELLAVSDYYSKDIAGAAEGFFKAASIDRTLKPMAAQSLANQAVKLADTDPALSLSYAQKAISLNGDTNSKFALGVAQIANKQTADGIQTLKGVHDSLSNPKDAVERFGVDSRLLTAYLATDDQADATTLVAEMKRLNPTSTFPAKALGAHYLNLGISAQNAKTYPQAVAYFNQAAAAGDPAVAVTANTSAAFSILDEAKPDYVVMLGYAQKAVAENAASPEANFAQGIAQTYLWSTSHQQSDKDKALDSLEKADKLAKAAGNTALAASVENFIAKNIERAPAPEQTPE